jgi:hypothetical protein
MYQNGNYNKYGNQGYNPYMQNNPYGGQFWSFEYLYTYNYLKY